MSDLLGGTQNEPRRRSNTTTTELRMSMAVLVASLLAAAVLMVASAPGHDVAAVEAKTTAISLSTSCKGVTSEDQAMLSSLGLAGLRIEASLSSPPQVPLGEPAEATVALAFELSDYLADGAKYLGIESVDLTGTTSTVDLVGPSGEQHTTVTPPTKVIDPRLGGRVDLGAATLLIPSAVPGAVAVAVDTATVQLRAEPGGRSLQATCSTGELPAFPYTFVVDPAAPAVSPATADLTGEERSSVVNLGASVTPPAGSGVGAWRVARTVGAGSATIEDGQLQWSLAEGSSGIDVVWEVCAVPPTTSTTSTTSAAPATSSTTVPDAAGLDPEPGGDDGTGADADSDGADTTDGSTTTPTSAPEDQSDDEQTTEPEPDTPHCAQGVVRVRPTLHSSVLSATSGSAKAGTATSPVAIAFTG